ncbi:MAG: PepSY-like domain-containing protein [Muribaculaceae bacterium]|nr:PepSY-like domain-containing protein [Muribaculaceae bacterium]
MKKILRLLPLLLIAVMGISLSSCSDNDEPVSSRELPSIAKDFIIVNYPSASIVSVEKDKSEYDVVLSDGTKIEFNKNGDWLEVEAAPTKSIPTGFYPYKIDTYLQENFQGLGITEITRVDRGYDVEISTGTELLFAHDGSFIMIGVDRRQ